MSTFKKIIIIMCMKNVYMLLLKFCIIAVTEVYKKKYKKH